MTSTTASFTDPTRPASATRRMLGADAVLRALEAERVEICFGMPGGAILPIYDAIARGTSMRHVLVRHEQGAGHMAQGYARASGRVGVVLATSGPGATNLVTPLADAMMDSTPLVCVTGQVHTRLLGTDAFQESDIATIVQPVVKHSWLVREVEELPQVLRAAFELARGGRPGPVLVDVPRDVQEAELDFSYPRRAALPGWHAPEPVDPAAAEACAAAIARAERPVLYAGGGVVGGEACEQLLALAELARIPVVTTLMGKGAIPERHELFAGWPGMHGARWANLTFNEADLVLAAGARFDDRVTGRLDRFAPGATVAHFEVDPYEIGKIRHADIPLLGGVEDGLAQVLAALHERVERGWRPRTDAWLAQVGAWREAHPLRYGVAAPGKPLKPQAVLERLDAAVGARVDHVWTTGVGQHQMWAMQYAGVQRPRSFVTSGGHGTMGFGLPAAIGAQAARPDATVVCVDGDGSFQMTLQELGTAVAERLPVVVVILNNGYLGMVCQWQTMFYAERLSHVDLQPAMPDFAAIARGYGALGLRVETLAELDAAIEQALSAERPVVLDVQVDPGERCLPMIVPGAAAVDMVEWPGHGDGGDPQPA